MVRRERRAKPQDPKPAAHAAPDPHAGLFPAFASLLDPRGPFLLPLLLLVIARLVAYASLPVASEDAYITFRYARHFAAGLGLVYNPGESVMGYTSPLWVVWNALGFVAGQDPVVWTRLTTLVTDVVTLLLMGQLLRRHASTTAAAAFGVFFAAWPFFAAMAASGMETNLMLLLIVLAAALSERRALVAGPALAALALVRPEGIAASAVLAVGASWRDRIVALVLAAAGWGALASVHGAWLPQSVTAKASLYGTPGPWTGRHWWEWLSPIQFGRWPATAEGNNLMVLTVILAPAFVFGIIALWKQRHTALALAIAAALAVWLGYAALGVAFFAWYLVVPLAGIAAAAAVGLPRLVASRALLVMLVLTVLGTWPVARVLYVGRTQNEYFAFAGAADYLKGAAVPGQSVMLEPIGMIGFQCPLVVIDEVGLVSPEVAARRLKGAGWYADIASSKRPDWLVIRRSAREAAAAFAGAGAPFRNPAERDSLFAHYQLEHVADPGRSDMEVFRRVR